MTRPIEIAQKLFDLAFEYLQHPEEATKLHERPDVAPLLSRLESAGYVFADYQRDYGPAKALFHFASSVLDNES